MCGTPPGSHRYVVAADAVSTARSDMCDGHHLHSDVPLRLSHPGIGLARRPRAGLPRVDPVDVAFGIAAGPGDARILMVAASALSQRWPAEPRELLEDRAGRASSGGRFGMLVPLPVSCPIRHRSSAMDRRGVPTICLLSDDPYHRSA